MDSIQEFVPRVVDALAYHEWGAITFLMKRLRRSSALRSLADAAAAIEISLALLEQRLPIDYSSQVLLLFGRWQKLAVSRTARVANDPRVRSALVQACLRQLRNDLIAKKWIEGFLSLEFECDAVKEIGDKVLSAELGHFEPVTMAQIGRMLHYAGQYTPAVALFAKAITLPSISPNYHDSLLEELNRFFVKELGGRFAGRARSGGQRRRRSVKVGRGIFFPLMLPLRQLLAREKVIGNQVTISRILWTVTCLNHGLRLNAATKGRRKGTDWEQLNSSPLPRRASLRRRLRDSPVKQIS